MGWNDAFEFVGQFPGKCGDIESFLFSCVRGKNGRASRGGDKKDPVPRRRFEVREGFGKIEELLDGFRPADAVAFEKRGINGVRAGQRLGVGFGGDPPPGVRPDLRTTRGLERVCSTF